MTLIPTRTLTSLLATAALAGALLATGSGTTASAQPITVKSPGTGAAHLLAGDVRVWELNHPYVAQASTPMAGDVRVWDLIHSPGR